MVNEWKTAPDLWQKLKPLAKQMRHNPTPAEQKLWQCLRNRQVLGLKFRRQHTIERFVVDFYSSDARLVIEVDGPIHEYTPEEDTIRQEFLESLRLVVLRFTNNEVLDNTGFVIEAIESVIKNKQV